MGFRLGLPLCLLAVTLGSFARQLPARAQEGEIVDLELALLVDVSASVDDQEYRLQAKGLAWALRSPAVLGAVGALTDKGIAVAVIQWANESNQRMAVPWSPLRGPDDALRLASRVASMPRLIAGGHTAISSALAFAARQIRSNRFAGLRRIIDVAGDGRNNDGPPLRAIRRQVLSQGITINGLAILNELPFLDRYFRDHLIGGEDAFYMAAGDYLAFARAMSEKLAREIRSAPMSQYRAPQSPPKGSGGTSVAANSGREGGGAW